VTARQLVNRIRERDNQFFPTDDADFQEFADTLAELDRV